jgi:hypothetical protein
MMLSLWSSPCLPNNCVHLGMNKTQELEFVSRSLGVLPISRKFPNDRIFNIKLEVHIIDKNPKFNKLRKVYLGEGALQTNFLNPFTIAKSLRNRLILPFGGLKDGRSNILWRSTI